MADPRNSVISLNQAIEILGLQSSQRSQAHLLKLSQFLRSQDGFFSALSHVDTQIVSKWLGYEYVYPSQPVYKQGDFGESMYIVIGGTCEFLTPNYATASGQQKGPDLVLAVGQSFGETVLVAPRRPRSRTVLASPGDGGAHLVTLNRSALSSLKFMGAAQADAGQALQAILSACCLGVIRQAPGTRSAEDVEMLAEFMANMEAFKKLPPEMIWRLASDCAHVRVPAGRVLFEEDTPGNAMYVVISGRCQVRARPLALRAKFGAGSSRSLLRPGSLGIGMTMTPRRHHTSGATGGGGGGGGGYRSMLESTPRSMLSLGSSSIAGAAAEASATGTAAALAPFGGGSGNVVRYQSDGRVATVMTLRGGERQRHGMVPGGGAGEDTDEEHTSQVTVNTGPPPVAASRSSTGSGSGSGSGISTTGKDSPFWIARFMEDALKRLHLSDSNAG
ncbi:hypothetical protein Vafri_16223, partial [Volvox africanus]